MLLLHLISVLVKEMSQLVYTSTIHQTDVLKMWSPRWLQDHSLVTDAILGFNYPCSTDHRDVAACKTVNSVGRWRF